MEEQSQPGMERESIESIESETNDSKIVIPTSHVYKIVQLDKTQTPKRIVVFNGTKNKKTPNLNEIFSSLEIEEIELNKNKSRIFKTSNTQRRFY